MTRDEIISMFHEAGKAAGWKPGVGNKLVINYLTHFAALAAAAEREAIESALTNPENQPSQWGTVTIEHMDQQVAAEREACANEADRQAADEPYGHAKFRCANIAAAIRARSK